MAITDGREGLEAFWTRQFRWRVDLHWYAVALLTTPILLLAILGTLSLTSSTFILSVFASEDVVQLVAFALIPCPASGRGSRGRHRAAARVFARRTSCVLGRGFSQSFPETGAPRRVPRHPAEFPPRLGI